MKRKLITALCLTMVVVSVLCLFACSDKTTEKTVDKYEIAETKVNVGDTHGNPTITATFNDGTTQAVSNNLVFDAENIKELALEDGKYTKAGTYTVKVYIIEQRDDLYIGEWKITVKAIK